MYCKLEYWNSCYRGALPLRLLFCKQGLYLLKQYLLSYSETYKLFNNLKIRSKVRITGKIFLKYFSKWLIFYKGKYTLNSECVIPSSHEYLLKHVVIICFNFKHLGKPINYWHQYIILKTVLYLYLGGVLRQGFAMLPVLEPAFFLSQPPN